MTDVMVQQAIDQQQDTDSPMITIVAPEHVATADFYIPASVWRQLQLQSPETIMSFQSNQISYDLPVAALDLSWLADELNTDAQDFMIHMTLEQADWATYMDMIQSAHDLDAELLSEGIAFEVAVETNDGRRLVINDFNGKYMTRSIVLQRYIPHSGLTAVRYDPEKKTMQFVPALFEATPSGTIATIKSSSNSLYAVVRVSKTFVDISTSYAKNDIELLASKLIIHGKSDHLFDPTGLITRSEFSALLVRALGLKPITSHGEFTDVTAEAWYSNIVTTAARIGLIVGSEGRFRPNDAITREEAAVILYRALQRSDHTKKYDADGTTRIGDFHDHDQVNDWAHDAIENLLALDIMTGFTDHTLRIKQRLTREETAILIRKLLQKLTFIN